MWRSRLPSEILKAIHSGLSRWELKLELVVVESKVKDNRSTFMTTTTICLSYILER